MTVQATVHRTGHRVNPPTTHRGARRIEDLSHESLPVDPALLASSDETIRLRTGLGWDEWFALLDAWGAGERTHRDIARWVAERQGVDPLAWNAQAVAGSYELVRGLRSIGEKAEGLAVSVSRTVAAPAERAYEAFVDASVRRRWLPDGELRRRTATPCRSARFDWGDFGTRIQVTFTAKDDGTVVTVSHQRLTDEREAAGTRTYWRERLEILTSLLEAGELREGITA